MDDGRERYRQRKQNTKEWEPTLLIQLRPEDHDAIPLDRTSRDISVKVRHVAMADCSLEL